MSQIGTWRAYMSYYEPQQIVKAGSEDLFVRASNSLYRYNLTDHSITTYDRVRQLNDTYISMIAWNNTTKQLIIVYNNSNIDILDLHDNVVNLSALYLKSTILDKTINNIYIQDAFAYLATGFGVVKVDMSRIEVRESYILNENITDVAIRDNTIYAKSSGGTIFLGDTSKNLIDFHNWTTGEAPQDAFTVDNSAWDEYIETVNTLKPGGPKYNHFGFMRFKHDRLYTVGCGFIATMEMQYPGTIQILNNDEWEILPDNIKDVTGWNFLDMNTVDAAPDDPNHIFASGRSGLYEYRNGEFYKAHNIDNSPLEGFDGNTYNDYVLVMGMSFDSIGNLWLLNSMALDHSLLRYTKNEEWVSHHKKEFINKNFNHSFDLMERLFIDSRGYIWFVNNHHFMPSFYCYDPATDQVLVAAKNVVNQDYMFYPLDTYAPTSIKEDLEGNIWIGTKIGPFMIEKDRITGDNSYLTQVKVPRNDGTNYADYLLANVNITDIVVDGGGRKWFATQDNGLYLISADNFTEIHHFTTNNSPLISNQILSLAIDNKTGELYIGTDMGLCSYMTDATESSSSMTKDQVYAYPNPVISGYEGMISIVGLSLNADVKILSASGQLVAQGRSNGGTFTWDGKDSNGKRVASGVYMVATATSEGNKGTVCKIAIIN